MFKTHVHWLTLFWTMPHSMNHQSFPYEISCSPGFYNLRSGDISNDLWFPSKTSFSTKLLSTHMPSIRFCSWDNLLTRFPQFDFKRHLTSFKHEKNLLFKYKIHTYFPSWDTVLQVKSNMGKWILEDTCLPTNIQLCKRVKHRYILTKIKMLPLQNCNSPGLT